MPSKKPLSDLSDAAIQKLAKKNELRVQPEPTSEVPAMSMIKTKTLIAALTTEFGSIPACKGELDKLTASLTAAGEEIPEAIVASLRSGLDAAKAQDETAAKARQEAEAKNKSLEEKVAELTANMDGQTKALQAQLAAVELKNKKLEEDAQAAKLRELRTVAESHLARLSGEEIIPATREVLQLAVGASNANEVHVLRNWDGQPMKDKDGKEVRLSMLEFGVMVALSIPKSVIKGYLSAKTTQPADERPAAAPAEAGGAVGETAADDARRLRERIETYKAMRHAEGVRGEALDKVVAEYAAKQAKAS